MVHAECLYTIPLSGDIHTTGKGCITKRENNMNQTIHCPNCLSENNIFSKKRGVHVCKDCDHEFTPEKPFVIASADGHRSLVSQGWEQFERGPESMDDYFLAWLPSHLRELGDRESLTRLLKDFRFLMHRMQCGKLERTLEDYRELPARFTSPSAPLEFEAAFFRDNAHILRRGNAEWPAHRILLQLAVEHADDSPLTIGAGQWLADGRCDWIWLWRNRRLPHVRVSPCLAVLEGHSSNGLASKVVGEQIPLAVHKGAVQRLDLAVFDGRLSRFSVVEADFQVAAQAIADGAECLEFRRAEAGRF